MFKCDYKINNAKDIYTLLDMVLWSLECWNMLNIKCIWKYSMSKHHIPYPSAKRNNVDIIPCSRGQGPGRPRSLTGPWCDHGHPHLVLRERIGAAEYSHPAGALNQPWRRWIRAVPRNDREHLLLEKKRNKIEEEIGSGVKSKLRKLSSLGDLGI
jgi:hypothetical protein